MIIPDYIDDALIILGKNLNVNEYFITAGMADYFNLKIMNLNVNISVGDIDLCINDKKILKKIEKKLNVRTYKYQEFDENPSVFSNDFNEKSHIIHYLVPNTCYDIYLLLNKNRFDGIKTKISKYKNIEIRHCLLDNSYLYLKNAINFNYNKSKKDKIIFKYLKKITLYNNLGYKV